ncbi:LysR family transcriptional regulator [Parvularcula lutaonensis]|uniref:LysR family transcriptional regulator n=1 Tax=Parvularcula lutaonensis TaxID=491923 RepID=A0ABV7M8Y4_9PROT|nr:LysR family transcriptional regulator [Parvularcula lutaonensis]GGY43291.1 LysR family transcriptional regulator [Parvularcula lutaonensis]
MDQPQGMFDWNQIRAFLATVEEGSLSGAARALGLTQPTLSRQVASLERDLGVTLFERGPRTMILTEAGRQLVDHVRAMGEAADRISLIAMGQSQDVKGHVKISMTTAMATWHMPKVLEAVRRAAPAVSVEIIGSNDLSDISRREADIAIRHARPEQPELIAKLIGETSAHLFASKKLLNRVGRPRTADDLRKFDVIGFNWKVGLRNALLQYGINVPVRDPMIITEAGTALLQYVRQGLGISILTKDVLDLFPDLEIVLPDIGLIPVPVWLVTHRELHTSKRIRIVYDVLSEELGKLAA